MAGHLRFGRFELHPLQRRLLRDGEPVPLGARAFDVLRVLAEARGQLVTKGDLLDRVWPGLVVEESNVQVQVSALRKAVGDGAVATIPGLGYRFIGAIDETAPQAPRVSAEFSSPRGSAISCEPRSGSGQAGAASGTLTGVPSCCALRYSPLGRPGGLMALPWLRPTSPLIGRAHDLAAAGDLLAAHALVSLVGPGGVGKTRLALSLAERRVQAGAEWVGWLDLSALSSGDEMAPALACACACGLPLNGHAAEASLLAMLAERRGLLVVDNCEHLLEPVAALLLRLSAAAPALSVLATSRSVLRLAHEQVHRVQPLELPPLQAGLDEARRFAALQLLEQRAAAADRRFELTPARLDDAIGLCRRLDGLPLAIEMAAARVPLLGLATLRRQLEEANSGVLHAACRDAPPRQRSLQDVLDWSHASLMPDEAVLLRRLAVFAGSFALDSALQVATDADLDDGRAIDALQALVDHSLVKLEQLEPPRYRLLVTTRDDARRRLAAAGEEPRLLRRHGEAMARRAEGLTDGHGTRPPLATRLADYADLDLAFEQACACHDGDLAAALVGGLRAIDQATGLLSASGRRMAAASRMLGHAGPRGQARLYSAIASCGWMSVPGLPRVEAARCAVERWRTLDDAAGLHSALCIHATESARGGDLPGAETALREAAALEDAGWAPRRVAARHVHQGWVASVQGDLVRVRESFGAAVGLFGQTDNPEMGRVARAWLGWATLAGGDTASAIAVCRKLLDEMAADSSAAVPSDAWVFAGVTLAKGLLLAGDTAGARHALTPCWTPAARSFHGGTVDWIDCTALLAAQEGAMDDAALLLGLADARCGSGAALRDPTATRVQLQTVQRIETGLSGQRWRALTAAGACIDDAALQAVLLRRAGRPDTPTGT